jgi:hypothetical protein
MSSLSTLFGGTARSPQPPATDLAALYVGRPNTQLSAELGRVATYSHVQTVTSTLLAPPHTTSYDAGVRVGSAPAYRCYSIGANVRVLNQHNPDIRGLLRDHTFPVHDIAVHIDPRVPVFASADVGGAAAH